MNAAQTTRVDEFRQFKSQIRGSREYLIVGLDIAKRKHHGFLGMPTARRSSKG